MFDYRVFMPDLLSFSLSAEELEPGQESAGSSLGAVRTPRGLSGSGS